MPKAPTEAPAGTRVAYVSLIAQSRHPRADPAKLSRRLDLASSGACHLGQPINGDGTRRYRMTAWQHILEPVVAVPDESLPVDETVWSLLTHLADRRKRLRKLSSRWQFVLLVTIRQSVGHQVGLILEPQTCFALGLLGIALALKVVPPPETSEDNPGVPVSLPHGGPPDRAVRRLATG